MLKDLLLTIKELNSVVNKKKDFKKKKIYKNVQKKCIEKNPRKNLSRKINFLNKIFPP